MLLLLEVSAVFIMKLKSLQQVQGARGGLDGD